VLRDGDCGEECILGQRRIRRIALEQNLAAQAVQESVAPVFPCVTGGGLALRRAGSRLPLRRPACESPLLVVGVRRSGYIRQEDLRLAQRINSLMHRNGILPRDGLSAGFGNQRRLDRTTHRCKRSRDCPPHRFHGHDRRRKRRGI
jgi:hypothetical protein